MAIQNPSTWGWERLRIASAQIGSARPEAYWRDGRRHDSSFTLHRLTTADLRHALAAGWQDFTAHRTDVIFLCLIYPLAGLLLARVASGYEMLPLLFPLASGFALIGPLASVGLIEMSRRREQGDSVGWRDAFGVLRAPSIGAIVLLGAVLMGILGLWLVVAQAIFVATLGPLAPESAAAFARAVFGTGGGFWLIVLGVGVGFLFATGVLAISVVAFPMLLDRDVGISQAVSTSIAVVAANPGVMALWGLVIAGGLVAGSIPLLVGLAVVMPVLGHASWHLYRMAVD